MSNIFNLDPKAFQRGAGAHDNGHITGPSELCYPHIPDQGSGTTSVRLDLARYVSPVTEFPAPLEPKGQVAAPSIPAQLQPIDHAPEVVPVTAEAVLFSPKSDQDAEYERLQQEHNSDTSDRVSRWYINAGKRIVAAAVFAGVIYGGGQAVKLQGINNGGGYDRTLVQTFEDRNQIIEQSERYKDLSFFERKTAEAQRKVSTVWGLIR